MVPAGVGEEDDLGIALLYLYVTAYSFVVHSETQHCFSLFTEHNFVPDTQPRDEGNT